MKILMILEYFKPHLGGVETLFDHLAQELSTAGHQVTILTSNHTGDLPSIEVMDRITIHRVNVNSRYLFTWKAFFPAYQLSKEVDIIQTTSYNAALPAFLAALINRKKSVITFHEVWGKLWFSLPFSNKISALFHAFFEKILLLLPFNLFVAVSNATKKRLLENGVSGNRIKVIHNGLSYRHREVSETNNKVYTYFGRLGMSKGLDLLLPASIPFLKENPDFKLRLITPQEPIHIYQYLQKIIQKNSLEKQIEWKHEVPDQELENLLLTSKWVVIPSYSEGFCFAAAESAALGIPILASDKGSLPEVVSGFHIFFKPHSILSLTHNLKKARDQKWEFKPLIKFELNHTVQSYIEIYQQMLQD